MIAKSRLGPNHAVTIRMQKVLTRFQDDFKEDKEIEMLINAKDKSPPSSLYSTQISIDRHQFDIQKKKQTLEEERKRDKLETYVSSKILNNSVSMSPTKVAVPSLDLSSITQHLNKPKSPRIPKTSPGKSSPKRNLSSREDGQPLQNESLGTSVLLHELNNILLNH